MNDSLHRRAALKIIGGVAASAPLAARLTHATDSSFSRPEPKVEIVYPRDRIPLSFIIDDSTCLVNMGRYCMPQFAEAWPERKIYRQPWNQWPHEIPDAFVREFGEWCGEHHVKGKYSIVPYPAMVGWLDRGLPGWSRRELKESLKLVRELMMPNWDIHPEMITHTRVIDIKTGRPVAGANAATMENSFPQSEKSVDEMAAYMAYALQILKNCDLPCEGITTPGGFGNRVKRTLPVAVRQAVQDVFPCDLPHFFKYVVSGKASTEPTLEFVTNQRDVDQLTVNVPAGTGDWFGGWEGTRQSEGHRYCNRDATAGRMVELIERGQPAVMLCHWPGMYCNGTKSGFHDFQKVVEALGARFGDRTCWMKVSEIARYFAVRQLAELKFEQPDRLAIESPFSGSDVTLKIDRQPIKPPTLELGKKQIALTKVAAKKDLRSMSYFEAEKSTLVCCDIGKGKSTLLL